MASLILFKLAIALKWRETQYRLAPRPSKVNRRLRGVQIPIPLKGGSTKIRQQLLWGANMRTSAIGLLGSLFLFCCSALAAPTPPTGARDIGLQRFQAPGVVQLNNPRELGLGPRQELGPRKTSRLKAFLAERQKAAGRVKYNIYAELCAENPSDPYCHPNGYEGWLYKDYFDWGLDFEVAMRPQLDGVTVYGIRPPAAWCDFYGCSEVQDFTWSPFDQFDSQRAGLGQDILDFFLGNAPANACLVPKAVNPAVRTTTSHSDDSTRFIAANAIIQYFIQGAAFRLRMANKELNVVFSDGGTETYIFHPHWSSVVRKEPSDLVMKSGVSNCP